MHKEEIKYTDENTSITVTTFLKILFIIFHVSERSRLHPASADYLNKVEAKHPPGSIGVLCVNKDHFINQELKAECKAYYSVLSKRVNINTVIKLCGHAVATLDVLGSDDNPPIGYPAKAVASLLREIKSDGVIMERSLYSFLPSEIYCRPLLKISVHACQAENFATTLFKELYNSKSYPDQILNAMITSTINNVIDINSATERYVTPTDPKDSFINRYCLSVINRQFRPRNHKLKYEFFNKKRVIYLSSCEMIGSLSLVLGITILVVILCKELGGGPLALFAALTGATFFMSTLACSQLSNAKHKIVLLPSTRQSTGEITLFKIPKVQYKLDKLNQVPADITSHTKSI